MSRIKDQGFLGAWTPIVATSNISTKKSRLDRQVPKKSSNVRGGGVGVYRQELDFFRFLIRGFWPPHGKDQERG